MSSDLEKSVEVVGTPWADTAYYAGAERFTHMFWREGTVYRRLFDQLDHRSVIELACGHGRHAEQAAPRCGLLTLIDIHEANLEACRARLRAFDNVAFLKSRGFAFDGVTDGGTSAIYCYDSMVHFSPDLVASYLHDTARVLQPGGMAIYHHSNYDGPPVKHYGRNPHARNFMTRERFAELTREAGLEVVEAVLMDWGDKDLDCVSLVRKP